MTGDRGQWNADALYVDHDGIRELEEGVIGTALRKSRWLRYGTTSSRDDVVSHRQALNDYTGVQKGFS